MAMPSKPEPASKTQPAADKEAWFRQLPKPAPKAEPRPNSMAEKSREIYAQKLREFYQHKKRQPF